MEDVIERLTILYRDEPTFDEEKIRVIVQNVYNEIVEYKRYKKAGYTEAQIESDMGNYKSQLYKISEYDFAHFGAPGEASHSENSVSRVWNSREQLFAGIIPLSDL